MKHSVLLHPGDITYSQMVRHSYTQTCNSLICGKLLDPKRKNSRTACYMNAFSLQFHSKMWNMKRHSKLYIFTYSWCHILQAVYEQSEPTFASKRIVCWCLRLLFCCPMLVDTDRAAKYQMLGMEFYLMLCGQMNVRFRRSLDPA